MTEGTSALAHDGAPAEAPHLGEPGAGPPAGAGFVTPAETERVDVARVELDRTLGDPTHTISDVVAAKGIAAAPAEPARRATPKIAIVMIMAAVFAFSMLDTTAKSLVTGEGGLAAFVGAAGTELSSVFVVWSRFAAHVILMAVLMGGIQRRPILRVRSWPWQATRAFCMSVATMCNFIALNYLQLAETVAIFFVAPMVVTALAGPFLGEWVGWRRWLAILAGFAGVLLMARPGTDLFQPALAFSIASMLGYSFYVLTTRKLASTESADSLLFISALLPGALLSFALPWGWTLPETGGQWMLVLSLGLYGVGGHFLFVQAYRLASTGALAPFTYVQIPFMVLLGWIVFGDLPDGPTLLGIAVIVAAGLYIVLRERQLAREEARAAKGADR